MQVLTMLRQTRTVSCPDCNGEGHVAAPPTEWERWVRAHTAAVAEHERVLMAYLAGEASHEDLDAAVAALTDVGMAAPDGHTCETCCGYGRQARQRKTVGRRAA
jgi:DnaJ-class molecular chaperone